MAIGVGLNFLVSFIFIPSVLAIKNISSNRNTNFVPFFYYNIYLKGRKFIGNFYLPIPFLIPLALTPAVTNTKIVCQISKFEAEDVVILN